MASIRDLKKDVNFLTQEVINDAFLAIGLHGNKVESKVTELLEEVVDFHNNIYEKIQQAPTGKKNPKIKKYFRSIREEINKQYPVYFEKLSNIIANK